MSRASRKMVRPRTREAKVAVACTAEDMHPKTGELRKEGSSGTVSAAIDSAAAVGGLNTRSDSATRLERRVHRTGQRGAEEIVVLSD